MLGGCRGREESDEKLQEFSRIRGGSGGIVLGGGRGREESDEKLQEFSRIRGGSGGIVLEVAEHGKNRTRNCRSLAEYGEDQAVVC